MAHHVAELINEAKKGSTAVARSRARKTATETILKIWEHRTSLPGEAYPLAPYKEVLKILALLRPDGNPFKHFGHHAGAKREQIAAILFDNLSRLIIGLLFMRVASNGRSRKVRTAPINTLSKTEQNVLKALQQWSDIFVSKTKSSKGKQQSNRGKRLEVNLKEAAVHLIDSIASTLVELRSELEKSATIHERGQREQEKS